MSTDWDSRRIARIALIFAVVLAAVWMQWRFLPALAWAAVLAIATWPLRGMLARRGLGPTAAAALLTLVLAIVLVMPLIGLGVEAARESSVIVEAVRDIRQNGLGTPDWLSHLPFVGDSVATWWRQNLADPGAARALLGRTETSGLIAFTRTLGIQVASRLTILVFTLLTLFFLYRDGPSLIDEAHRISDRVFGPSGGHLGRNAVAAVRGTVNGLVLVGLVEGVLLGVAYAATGLPHAVLLGLATGAVAHDRRDRAPRRRLDRRLRCRSFRAADPDRQLDPPALPLGPARHLWRARDVRADRSLPRPRHHVGADGDVARGRRSRRDRRRLNASPPCAPGGLPVRSDRRILIGVTSTCRRTACPMRACPTPPRAPI